jgi:hypothetical protein
VTITDLAGKSPLIVGRGNYVPTPAILYPQTGARSAFHTLTSEAVLAEAVDVPDVDLLIYECPTADSPNGVKGIGKITANIPLRQ